MSEIATPQPWPEHPITINGMVDDLGRPATIYTPPEVRRRDPNRWPTPEEFVSEWGRYTDAERLALATRILADAQSSQRLWRFEARQGDDDLKTDLELTCVDCDELVCDVQHLDPMAALVSTALDHRCREGARDRG